MRFYRGFALKCAFVALNGAIFNTVFVAVRKALRLTEEHELPPLRVEPAGRPASPSGGR